jgi:RHS repeat-associated protein
VTLASCTLPTPSTTGNENDLFYLELLYDAQFPGMTGDTLQRNGNINQMQWRTRGRERQAYNFSYDYLDRLRSAVYADVNDAGTVTTNNRFNESLTYADARGNIGTLRRQGPLAAGGCTYGQIDNLTYTYYTGMNRLKTITDGSTPMGFKPLAGATDYIYDVNGNMTTDPHKGLTITYNHLNLPKTFNFGGGKVIDILYDAAGNKLKKTITGSASNYNQDYIGGIEYRSGLREAIYHAEGRVFYTSPTTPRYEYTIKDHLGNARLSFSDVNANGTVDFTTEVLQENHYYPFGLNFDGNWKNDAARDNKYQYNGKEWNDDFGLNLNDYGARWYDAARIVWFNVDSKADKYVSWSPYNYTLNNPMRFIDPDGKAPIPPNDYFDKNGKHVGSDKNGNDIRIVSNSESGNFLNNSTLYNETALSNEAHGAIAKHYMEQIGANYNAIGTSDSPSTDMFAGSLNGDIGLKYNPKTDVMQTDNPGILISIRSNGIIEDPLLGDINNYLSTLEHEVNHFDSQKFVGGSAITVAPYSGDLGILNHLFIYHNQSNSTTFTKTTTMYKRNHYGHMINLYSDVKDKNQKKWIWDNLILRDTPESYRNEKGIKPPSN